MQDEQVAQLIMRIGRKRGLTFRVERPTHGEPIVHVGPRQLVSPYLRLAIPRCKDALITLLESEGTGTVTGEDGRVWTQTLARCPQCGACDWGIIRTERDAGHDQHIWGCQTCHLTAESAKHAMKEAAHVLRLAPKKMVSSLDN